MLGHGLTAPVASAMAMPNNCGNSRLFALLYPSARHASRRVRGFVDFLIEKFSA
jgi:hypothetical protein